MPTPKKPAVKKTASKSFKINFQSIGVPPEQVSVKAGTTIKQLAADRNVEVEGYIFSVNGEQVDASYELKKADIVRIAPKTKNA